MTQTNPAYDTADVHAAHRAFSIEGVGHLALVVMPPSDRPLQDQTQQVLEEVGAAVSKHLAHGTPVAQTVFVRDASHVQLLRDLLAAHYGADEPVTTYVVQPPCNGASLAVESWAVAADSAKVVRAGPQLVTVSYNDITWLHCGDIFPPSSAGGVYDRSAAAFAQMKTLVERAGGHFDHLVRTWLYLGDIVGPEGKTQRYKELNRARTDFYRDTAFGRSHRMSGVRGGIYPASTGIGMAGTDLAMSCLALDTHRKDVFLLPLENPQQTPAYNYHARYSPQSPKFSRAMAVAAGTSLITFVSGTASIVNSETRYRDDAEKQTDQTIENIERLISAENLAAHGLPGAGATLSDLAAVRVYIKHPETYQKCRSVCEKRLGAVPALYLVADVCRPDLLVEIEGVAFSRRSLK